VRGRWGVGRWDFFRGIPVKMAISWDFMGRS
jgi:hypothetical protein